MLVLPDTPRFANQNKGVMVLRVLNNTPYFSNGSRWVIIAAGTISPATIHDSLEAYNARVVTSFNGRRGAVKGIDTIYFNGGGDRIYWRYNGAIYSHKASGIDSLYTVPGQDSLAYLLGGVEYKISAASGDSSIHKHNLKLTGNRVLNGNNKSFDITNLSSYKLGSAAYPGGLFSIDTDGLINIGAFPSGQYMQVDQNANAINLAATTVNVENNLIVTTDLQLLTPQAGKKLKQVYWDENTKTVSVADTSTLTGTGNPRIIYLSQQGILSDADVSEGSTNFGTDQTAAIQAIYNLGGTGNPIKIIWDVKASVTGLRVKGNTETEALAGMGAILRNNSNNPLFINYDSAFARAPVDSNIIFRGGIWNGNGYNAGLAPAQSGSDDGSFGYNHVFSMAGVYNFLLTDFVIYRQRVYAVWLNNVKNGVVQNGVIKAGEGAFITSDGVHFDGNCQHGFLLNMDIQSKDDAFAITADDQLGGTYRPSGFAGPIDDIIVSGVHINGGRYGGRILSGGSVISNIKLSNISGSTEGYGLIIDNFYQGSVYLPGAGLVRNVEIENYNVNITTIGDVYVTSASIVLSNNIDQILFRALKRNNFTLDIPTIAVRGSATVINNLIIDGYDSRDSTSTFDTKHFNIAAGATVNYFELTRANVIRENAASNTSNLLNIEGTVGTAVFSDVTTKNINSVLRSNFAVSNITGVDLRTTNMGTGFVITPSSTSPDLSLTAVKGLATNNLVSGTLSSRRGTAFYGTQSMTTAQRTAFTPNYNGQQVYDTDLNNLYYWNGTLWIGSGASNNIAGLIAAGTNVVLTGAGSSVSPYVISASGGGGSAAPGNNGNIPIARNTALITPGTDSLNFKVGLQVKGSGSFTDSLSGGLLTISTTVPKIANFSNVNGGLLFRDYTGTSSYFGIYQSGVTPNDNNVSFMWNATGSEAYLCGSSNIYIGVNPNNVALSANNTNTTFYKPIAFSSPQDIGGYNANRARNMYVSAGYSQGVTTTASSLTLGITHSTVLLSATGLTVTLPSALGYYGRVFTIKLSASGTGTIATTSSQTIDGSTTYTLSAQNKYVTVISDDANWFVIANN